MTYNVIKYFLNKINLVFKSDNKILHTLSVVSEKNQVIFEFEKVTTIHFKHLKRVDIEMVTFFFFFFASNGNI